MILGSSRSGALRPWQSAVLQTYERDWSLERSRSVVSEGMTRLGALLEARLRRSTLRAETAQARVLFIIAVLQVLGLVGVLSNYDDLLEHGGVGLARLFGVKPYLLFLAGFFAATAATSVALALAARASRGEKSRS
jgi:hypothetical protein